MLSRIVVAALCVSLAAGGSVGVAQDLKQGPKGEHKGEILAIDKDGSTVTIRVFQTTEGEKETYVYHVDQKTVIKDKATGKDLTLKDLKVGDKVVVKGKHEGGKRVALEIKVRPPEKQKEEKKEKP